VRGKPFPLHYQKVEIPKIKEKGTFLLEILIVMLVFTLLILVALFK
jgi:competence protein ComGC